MLASHLKRTHSQCAREILKNWESEQKNFVKLVPDDYKKVMDILRSERLRSLSEDESVQAAFNAVIA